MEKDEALLPSSPEGPQSPDLRPDVKPGELASTVILPALSLDCTIAMQYPLKALRELPWSGS